MTPSLDITPDIKVSVKQTFGIESKMEVDAFSKKGEYVPEIDKNYKFDAVLQIMSSHNNVNKEIAFSGVFPISLSAVEFNAQNTDIEYVQADLVLKYTSFEFR